MLLFDATHHHAEVTGFDDYADALRLDDFLDGLGNLRGKALLDLETTRKKLDQARNFAQADYSAFWDIGDVHFAEKRQHVMLAEAEHLNVFDDDHFVVADREKGTFKQGFGVFLVALSEKLHGFGDA